MTDFVDNDSKLIEETHETVQTPRTVFTYTCKFCGFASSEKVYVRGHIADYHAVKDRAEWRDYKLFFFEDQAMFNLFVELNRYSGYSSEWHGPGWYTHLTDKLSAGVAGLLPVSEIINTLRDRATVVTYEADNLQRLVIQKAEAKLKK